MQQSESAAPIGIGKDDSNFAFSRLNANITGGARSLCFLVNQPKLANRSLISESGPVEQVVDNNHLIVGIGEFSSDAKHENMVLSALWLQPQFWMLAARAAMARCSLLHRINLASCALSIN
jgi:hypothetical protein